MPHLSIGGPAPDFALPASGSRDLALSELRGRKVVLFFYPKADTPACTLEAQAFSRRKRAFAEADTVVIGISGDPLKAQDRFRAKHAISVPLASDLSRATLNEYGVWVEKSMFGRRYMGIARTTLLIDRNGIVARIWPKVNVEGHVDEVLAAARAL
jgi:thioredoxin-dependent peroxiredoxin